MSNVGGPKSEVQGEGGWGQGTLYSFVQCTMGNSHMGIPPVDRMADRRTDTTLKLKNGW